MANALKSNSSRWVHEEISDMQMFSWQEGYGAFSVSRSNEETVSNYIRQQNTHHRKRDFKNRVP
jgi:putative transposase